MAKGTGDEKSSGVSTYLPEHLKNKTNGNISACNTGVNGLKSDGLVELLNGEFNILSKECRFVGEGEGMLKLYKVYYYII